MYVYIFPIVSGFSQLSSYFWKANLLMQRNTRVQLWYLVTTLQVRRSCKKYFPVKSCYSILLL